MSAMAEGCQLEYIDLWIRPYQSAIGIYTQLSEVYGVPLMNFGRKSTISAPEAEKSMIWK